MIIQMHTDITIYYSRYLYRPNSPGPLANDWKVTDDSSINFHEKFFLNFLLNLSKK